VYPAAAIDAGGKVRLLRGALLALGVWTALVAARETQAEVVQLVPEDRASWRARNIFAWVRPGHFYGARRIDVETSPPGATLDLFYVRSNFQKLYEQTTAPATVILPKRVEAGPRDAVTIRAFLPGFRQRETSVRVASSQDRVLLELDPLPNALRAVAHTYFAGRTSLTLLTDELPTVRVQERDEGFHLILAETALDPEAQRSLDGLRSPVVGGVEALQVGEDLLVQVALSPAAREDSLQIRSRQAHDPIRDVYRYAIDLVPADSGAAAVEDARAALTRLTSADVTGCAERFDEALRGALDAETLSRALAPSGAFTDPFLRAAMKRLGEVSPGGAVVLEDGTRLDTRSPLELTAATGQAAQARGFLALLRAFVRELEPGEGAREGLRSLIAPEMSPAEFAKTLAQAEALESACRGGGAVR
jgi:hypothetical protein